MIRLTDDTDWAALLRSLLDMGRVNQAALAEATGYDPSHISAWCTGRKTPGRDALIRIAGALGYDLALIPREDA